jgi:hypothetical protein
VRRAILATVRPLGPGGGWDGLGAVLRAGGSEVRGSGFGGFVVNELEPEPGLASSFPSGVGVASDWELKGKSEKGLGLGFLGLHLLEHELDVLRS